MTATDTARGELAPTRSYDRREYHWRAGDAYDVDHRDGTLTIKLTHNGKRRVRTEISVYSVQVELDVAVDFGVKAFLLENLNSPDPEGPFRCVVGGLYDVCGCESGRIASSRGESATCKHVAAALDLCAKGVIP